MKFWVVGMTLVEHDEPLGELVPGDETLGEITGDEATDEETEQFWLAGPSGWASLMASKYGENTNISWAFPSWGLPDSFRY